MSDNIDPIIEAYFTELRNPGRMPSEAARAVVEKFKIREDDLWTLILEFCRANNRSIA